jgi:hypothetical protein
MSEPGWAYPANVHLVWIETPETTEMGRLPDKLEAIFATSEQAFAYIGRAKQGARDTLRYEPWAVRQP